MLSVRGLPRVINVLLPLLIHQKLRTDSLAQTRITLKTQVNSTNLNDSL